MQLMPIVYVSDMERSVEFYGQVGLRPVSRSDYWSVLKDDDGGTLALHLATDLLSNGSQLDLSMTVDDSLEVFLAQSFDPPVEVVRPIKDEVFGRSVIVSDPDGLHIQVNQLRSHH